MRINPINEESLLVSFDEVISIENHLKVKTLYLKLKDEKGILSVVPSYTSLMVYFDITATSFDHLHQLINSIDIEALNSATEKKVIVVPVCYELGLDIETVMAHNNLSKEEVIDLHTSRDYLVYMVGFTPGFPYLGGMDERLTTPRLETPRTKIEAGSVGIGGQQTGIYPLDTPGGWQIIGKTPLILFDKNTSQTLFEMGDYIRFKAVDKQAFEDIENLIQSGRYETEVCYVRV